MASKIWVNIFGVMGDPKQVYISAKFCEFFFDFHHWVALSAWYRDYTNFGKSALTHLFQ